MLEGYREHTGIIAGEKKKSLEQVAVYEKKLSVARNLLVTEDIYLVNNLLWAKKNGTKDDISLLSRVVTSTGQISRNFMEDLKILAYYM